VRDDRVAFELLTLSVFQAGLSWQLVFSKRAAFARFFLDYDLPRLALADPDLPAAPIKNAAKLRATVANARAALHCAARHGGSFCAYLWSLVDGRIAHAVFDHCVTQDDLSRAVAAALKRDGFAFLGPVSAYSYLQSIGAIHAHKPTCRAFLPHSTVAQFEESLAVNNDGKRRAIKSKPKLAVTVIEDNLPVSRRRKRTDADDGETATTPSTSTTSSKKPRKVRCSICKQEGHNAKNHDAHQ
jgi:DNA-3-methyladenine glycosylase I